MLRWLHRIFIGVPRCVHKWKILHESSWSDAGFGTGGAYYILQCENCGTVKGKKA